MTALYKCYHCGKDFTIHGENIYAIFPLQMTGGIDSHLHWEWRKNPIENNLSATFISGMFFHAKCFEEVAGEKYTTK